MIPRLLVLAVLVAACGSDRTADDPGASSTAASTTQPLDTDPTRTTESTSPPTPPPTPSSTEPRPPVGSVIEVVTPGGDVDGQTAESGDPILRAGIVTTEAAGKIHFNVDEKIESCILRAQGRAVVVPGDGPLVRLDRGEATCRTRPGGGAVEIQAGGVRILVSDPVFRLGVDEAGGLTEVGRGARGRERRRRGARRWAAGGMGRRAGSAAVRAAG